MTSWPGGRHAGLRRVPRDCILICMSDQLDRLKAALADRYTIERELKGATGQ
jgi:hypothetical protein